MLYDNTDFDYEISFFRIPGSDFNKEYKTNKILSPEEGFLRGNLFANEYEPYKELTYFKLKPENERESLLFKLMAYSFAINDLNLYLDLHPENMEAYNLFKNIVKEKNSLEDMYVSKYGPMTVTESEGEMFNWIKNPWPWDKMGGSKYV